MELLLNDIKQMLEAIDQTTDFFYKQQTQEGYIRLDHALVLLMKVMDEITKVNSDKTHIEIDTDHVNQILNSAMQALEEKDTILFSDILQYELKEIFNEIINK